MDDEGIDFDRLARIWIGVGLACGVLTLVCFAIFYFTHRDRSPLSDFTPASGPRVSETPSSNGSAHVLPVEADAPQAG